MDSTETLMGKINYLISSNESIIEEMKSINRDVDSVIAENTNPSLYDTRELKRKADRVKVLQKKVSENSANIDSIASRLSFDEEYLENLVSEFKKKTVHVSNDIPETLSSNELINAIVVFRNMGMFYSWDLSKNISLNIVVSDNDNNIIDDFTFSFDPSYLGNEPGDELLNEDFEKLKTFDISFNFPITGPGDYIMLLRIYDGVDYFSTSFKKYVSVL